MIFKFQTSCHKAKYLQTASVKLRRPYILCLWNTSPHCVCVCVCVCVEDSQESTAVNPDLCAAVARRPRYNRLASGGPLSEKSLPSSDRQAHSAANSTKTHSNVRGSTFCASAGLRESVRTKCLCRKRRREKKNKKSSGLIAGSAKRGAASLNCAGKQVMTGREWLKRVWMGSVVVW